MAAPPRVRLLVVDYLDSYSYNIPAFLRGASSDATRLSVDVKQYNSLDKASVESISTSYHGVILSAGPGTVELEEDIGAFTPALLSHRPAIPVYGICLGFQAICRHFGCAIRPLPFPHHGLISEILDTEGNPRGRRATRYHSLEVELGQTAQEQLQVLAVAENYDNPGGKSCIMEVRHRELPFWGVQYHPESVYSSGCRITVQPFLCAAQDRCISSSCMTTKPSIGTYMEDSSVAQLHGTPVAWKCVKIETDLLEVIPIIKRRATDFVLLDSSSKGRWDILAAADIGSIFQYSVRNQRLSFKSLQTPRGGGTRSHLEKDCSATLEEAWSFLREFSSRETYIDGPPDVPFWGGFIGYFGYELGLSELGLEAYRLDQNNIPEYGDTQLLWSTETLAYCKITKTLYAMSLRRDFSWIDSTLERLSSRKQSSSQQVAAAAAVPWIDQYKFDHPNGRSYVENIKAAQREIKLGNSYEICLTATSRTRPIAPSPAHITSSRSSDGEPSLAQRFHLLRATTPANLMSLMNLGGVQVLSASPEEFLSYDAHTNISHMKPIKGTLPKSDVHGNPISAQTAQEILHEPKTIAENLMIVDLVRHDLSKVSSKVTCPNLMHVEDIGPMYQLISTVQAEVGAGNTAWDLIRHSMPPGSMTGAPKRRSCEILQRLEQDPRGFYSGITGYVDVRGHCRTSVNIRNAVKYPGESHWRIGAGGAITSLSDPVEEWHERQLKASSVCRSLSPQFSILETVLWDPDVTPQLLYWDEHVARLLKTVRSFDFDIPFVDSKIDGTEAEANGVDDISGPMSPNSVTADSLTTNSAITSPSPLLEAPDARTNGASSLDRTRRSEATDSSHRGPHHYHKQSEGKVLSRQLSTWITHRLQATNQHNQALRLSLEISSSGHPSLTTTPIPPSPSTPSPVTVHLDPCTLPITPHLAPFITHKTTNRTHYLSARVRANVTGRDEVLLFRPAHGADAATLQAGSPIDYLTEGSYTNVAVWDDRKRQWCTPSGGCLPGIMREKLLASGAIAVGEVQRRQLVPGTTVRLFNSVRGVFEGVVRER